jgi:hypothetical protein
MKIHLALLSILFILFLSNQTVASFWFQVNDITPIVTTPNTEANFTVSVKGLGSERAYVELVFKNISDGLEFTCPKMIKNVYPAGVTKYNCSVKVGDLPAGNYSFVVDVAAHSSPSGKKTAFVNVVTSAEQSDAFQPKDEIDSAKQENSDFEDDEDGQTQAEIPEDKSSESSADKEAQESPAPGAAAAILVLMLVMKRIGR